MVDEKIAWATLNAEEFERLQRRARQEGLGPSEMVKKVVEDWLRKLPVTSLEPGTEQPAAHHPAVETVEDRA